MFQMLVVSSSCICISVSGIGNIICISVSSIGIRIIICIVSVVLALVSLFVVSVVLALVSLFVVSVVLALVSLFVVSVVLALVSLFVSVSNNGISVSSRSTTFITRSRNHAISIVVYIIVTCFRNWSVLGFLF